MKVAFYNVTASFIQGGLETYCWEAGRALARRGHDVTIVAGNRGHARHSEVALVQYPFRAEKEWPDFGVRFRRLAERMSFAYRGSYEHLMDSRYDAIVVNKPFDFPILWRARRAGLKATTLFRSGGTDFFPMDKYFSDAIDIWASTSRYNAGQIHSRYGRAVEVIHNGVDIGAFSPALVDGEARAQLARPDQLIVMSVGRLVGWKGLHVIVQAMVDLPSAVYVVVGSGPEEGPMRDLASKLGVAERVVFAGRVAHADLPRLLAQADLFVQPSIGEEAFGISVVEAMASGLAVLASSNGGLPEIVVDGATGLLLTPGDVAAWSGAIRALVTDESRRKSMGNAGRERAHSDFTWAANAARLDSLLMGAR